MSQKSILILLFVGAIASTCAFSLEELISKSVPKQVVTPQAVDNEFIDKLLANVRSQLIANNLSTITVPTGGGAYYDQPFSIKILGITYRGLIRLSDLHVDGLATLHRTGAVEITFEPNGDIVASVDVGLNDCGLGSGLYVQFVGLSLDGSIAGYLKNVRVELKIRVNFSGAAALEKFDIKNMGTLSIDIKGLGAILNVLAELIANIFGNLVKGLIGELLQGPIKLIVNSILQSLLNPKATMSLPPFQHVPPPAFLPRY